MADKVNKSGNLPGGSTVTHEVKRRLEVAGTPVETLGGDAIVAVTRAGKGLLVTVEPGPDVDPEFRQPIKLEMQANGIVMMTQGQSADSDAFELNASWSKHIKELGDFFLGKATPTTRTQIANDIANAARRNSSARGL